MTTCKNGEDIYPCPNNCSGCKCKDKDLNNFDPQPKPIPNDLPKIPDLVIDDMRARAEFGYNKYGTYLQAFNGRDVLRDAYEEALDLCQYLRQAIYERDRK